MPPTVKKYLLVIKPGIVCGNLIAAIGGFFLASHGHPDFAVLASTALGRKKQEIHLLDVPFL